jgi:hypothetical protein
MQYSLVFEDARVDVYNHLVQNEQAYWNAPAFENYQNSWLLPIYLRSYSYFVWIPMMKLYLQGPSLGNLGFWQGKSKRDICATITAIDAEFWTENMDKCNQTILRKIESFLTLSHVLLVSSLFFTVCYWIFTNWFYSRLIDQITENLVNKVLNHRLFLDFSLKKPS